MIRNGTIGSWVRKNSLRTAFLAGPFLVLSGCSTQSGDSGSPPAVTQADWQLGAANHVPAKIPMEIINPRPGLTTASRYYKCYPGLEWRVPVSVLGGAWPFKYELVSGPAGMTIGSTHGTPDYGVLSWANPTGSGSPHAITIRVTDQEGTTATVSWNLAVGTDGFLFLDANAGDDANPGTIDRPKKTMAGWLELGTNARNLATYDNYQIYYRTGTYYLKYDYDPAIDNSTHGQMKMRRKPDIHLAYPGEKVVFDLGGDGGSFPGGSFFFADAPNSSDNDDIFFQGIEWRNVCANGDILDNYYWHKAVILGRGTRMVVFENIFTHQADASQTAGPLPGQNWTNGAYFLFLRDLSDYGKKYISFHNNEIQDLKTFMFSEVYDAEKMVFEGNTFTRSITAVNDNRLVYFKELSRQASVRNNTGTDNLDVMLAQIGSSNGQYDEIEIAWNNWKARANTTRNLWFGIEPTMPMGRIYVYRNTLTGGVIHHQATAGGGPVWYQNNVRQYGSGVNGIENEGGAFAPLFSVQGTETDHVARTGLVDAVTNLLTGDSRTAYLGKKGHEVY